MRHLPSPLVVAASASALSLALGLAACGSTPVEVSSASASGEVAGWGTKGVEANIVNGVSEAYYYAPLGKVVGYLRVGNRGDYTGTRTLDPGQSTTFWGDNAVVDDIELTFTGPLKDQFTTDWQDMDFANPSVGCPNASVGHTIHWFCSEGTEHYYETKVGSAAYRIWMKREPDSSDNKRFTVRVSFDRTE